MTRITLLALILWRLPGTGISAGPPAPPLTFRLYSDFTCPFCYVTEESTVERLLLEYDVILDWRGFELHPEIAPGGITRAELLPGQDVRVIHAGIQRFARSFGVFLPDLPARIPNTRKALAVAEYARDAGRLDDFRRAMLRFYWQEGADLEDVRVLQAAVRLAGLDPAQAADAMYDSEYRRRVDGMSDEAARVGVTGIPTFVFPLSAPLVGCQSWAVVEAAAVAAGARRRIVPPPTIPVEPARPDVRDPDPGGPGGQFPD